MQIWLSTLILDSLTSIQSGGQTEIHAPQKSHLLSWILIIIYKQSGVMYRKPMPIIVFR
jgi:hypothetical protein